MFIYFLFVNFVQLFPFEGLHVFVVNLVSPTHCTPSHCHDWRQTASCTPPLPTPMLQSAFLNDPTLEEQLGSIQFIINEVHS